jgi:RTA1 like protein
LPIKLTNFYFIMNSTNTTEFYPENCTYETCSVEDYGQIRYVPSLAGNAFYIALFALFLITQILLGVRYRTWGFLVGMVGGLALEIVGYIGRILLHFDDFDFNNFIIYIVCLTIGPAFLAAAIYLCLARIIAIYGSSFSWFEPRTITCFFIFCDFVSLVLQAAGGAIASTSDDEAGGDLGVNIMIAGLATQVASMLAFVFLCVQIAWNVWRSSVEAHHDHKPLIDSSRFRFFLWGECAKHVSHPPPPPTPGDLDMY